MVEILDPPIMHVIGFVISVVILLRAVTSEDGMTADFYEFKKSFIQMISNKIVNSIRGINRVVYDITSKPPSTIELE